MNKENERQNPNSNHDDSIPVARPSRDKTWESVTASSLWWVTLVCLVVALGLVWWSLPESGILVEVTFPDGHGLQAEDQILYRGIEVGVVEDVELQSDLNSVRVDLLLNSSAQNLAREGTQFWIVRPQLSFSRIAGLETAVGHKYVSLSPGPNDAVACYEFEGLVEQPPTDSELPGLEFVLRGDKRHSVSPGSSVTFRGVVVGRVLSVGLSQDSRFVDIRAKIFQRYKRLLTPASRFWAASGFNFDFSLKDGLRFDSESIASIAQGGVSFVNIANETEPVQTGQVFRLNSAPEDEWLQAA
ncbi:MAG: MlaD family protein, partial [Planctomycetota bacterium]